MDGRDLRIAPAFDRHRTLGEAGRALRLDPTTAVGHVASWVLAPRLAALRARHPELVLDLRSTEQVLMLGPPDSPLAEVVGGGAFAG